MTSCFCAFFIPTSISFLEENFITCFYYHPSIHPSNIISCTCTGMQIRMRSRDEASISHDPDTSATRCIDDVTTGSCDLVCEDNFSFSRFPECDVIEASCDLAPGQPFVDDITATSPDPTNQSHDHASQSHDSISKSHDPMNYSKDFANQSNDSTSKSHDLARYRVLERFEQENVDSSLPRKPRVVLKLLDEVSGCEREVHLCGEW